MLINHYIVSLQAISVKTHQEWSEQLSQYLELGRLAQQTNAPVNEVFDSRDVNQELANLRAALLAFNNQLAALKSDAQRQQTLIRLRGMQNLQSKFEEIPNNLNAVSEAMVAMTNEAQRIFDYFRQHRPDLAGQRIAIRDRKYAALLQASDRLRGTVVDIQTLPFKEELNKARNLQSYELLIAALGLLMLGIAKVYGWQLKNA